MSRWVTDSTENSGSGGGSASSGSGVPADGRAAPHLPLWLRAVPFFLSSFLFLSAFFVLFAPFPLLLSRFRAGRKWMWLAALTNSVLVALASGWVGLAIYLVFVVAFAGGASEALIRLRSLEKTVIASVLAIFLAALVLVLSYSVIKRVNPIQEFRAQVSSMVDSTVETMSAGSGRSKSAVLGGLDPAEFKDQVRAEMPAVIGVFSLLLAVLNLVLLLRVNPGGIAQRAGLNLVSLRYWRAPEFLVWPTIVAGVFLVVDFGQASATALGVFKFLMAIYALQGLSILSFFFDLWKIQGVFRLGGYLVALLLMMPLVLSLGFFDLWFDFRSKFRQS